MARKSDGLIDYVKACINHAFMIKHILYARQVVEYRNLHTKRRREIAWIVQNKKAPALWVGEIEPKGRGVVRCA